MSDAPAPAKTTVSITLDGRSVEAKPGELVIAAAQRHGVYVPRFCYHERMEPVGMCRQCMVEVDTGRGPVLTVSCMAPVAEGMVVSSDSEKVRKAQEGVLEFLLINHPLDCPVCDKGGECPLQDQAVSHGPGESRFVEEKRHFEKPIAISELVFLDRERCILCDRCTRFAKDVAGDPLIHFTHRGNETQILTFPDEPFSSYFSGNTVQICPVGALTAKPYRFKARPWDLEQVESTCTTCSVGCRVTVQSSRNQLLRLQGVDSDPVNWGWLCDRGRFNFEAVNSENRLRVPLMRKGNELAEATWDKALDAAAFAISQAIEQHGPASVAVLGGARGTNEDAYAWAKLAKAVIGTDNVDAQLGDGLPPDLLLGLPRATIDEVCAAKTVILLGPDLKEELPVLYLRLRDVAEKRTLRLLELSPRDTGLTPYTWQSLRYTPGEQPALVSTLLSEHPAQTSTPRQVLPGSGRKTVGSRQDLPQSGQNGGRLPGGVDAEVAAAVREQLAAGPVAVVVGRANLAESAAFTVAATLAIQAALPEATFLPVARRGNVLGALDAGLAPRLAPGRATLVGAGDTLAAIWGSVPPEAGLDATGILQAAAAGKIACLVLLGADPIGDFPDRDLARRALVGASSIVAIDTFITESSRQADVVLPAAAYAEKAGSTTNFEGRVSTIAQAVTPVGSARADWILAAELAYRLGGDLGIESPAAALLELASVAPTHAGVTAAALRANGDGVLVAGGSVDPVAVEPPPLPAAGGYTLRLVASRKLYDAAVSTAQSPAMSGLAPGARLHMNPYDFDRLGVSTGTAVKVKNGDRAIALEAQIDAGVPRGSAWVAFNQPGVAVAALIDVTAPVTDIQIDTL